MVCSANFFPATSTDRAVRRTYFDELRRLARDPSKLRACLANLRCISTTIVGSGSTCPIDLRFPIFQRQLSLKFRAKMTFSADTSMPGDD